MSEEGMTFVPHVRWATGLFARQEVEARGGRISLTRKGLLSKETRTWNAAELDLHPGPTRRVGSMAFIWSMVFFLLAMSYLMTALYGNGVRGGNLEDWFRSAGAFVLTILFFGSYLKQSGAFREVRFRGSRKAAFLLPANVSIPELLIAAGTARPENAPLPGDGDAQLEHLLDKHLIDPGEAAVLRQGMRLRPDGRARKRKRF
jgi:hypothetical protein